METHGNRHLLRLENKPGRLRFSLRRTTPFSPWAGRDHSFSVPAQPSIHSPEYCVRLTYQNALSGDTRGRKTEWVERASLP